MLAVLASEREQMQQDPTLVFGLVNDILASKVDFQRVSGLVLGKYWRRASPAQRQRFAEEFRRLLIRTYATAFNQFQSWEINYLPARAADSATDAVVRTEVLRPDGPPVAVDYRMHLKDGQWLVYDVTIEGISLVTNYRSTFAKEVRMGGMDGLIQRIADMNDQRMEAAKGDRLATAVSDSRQQ